MNAHDPGDDGSGVDLSEFDEDFADAQIEENEFEPIPDGKYQVSVEKVEITTSKTSGNPMLHWSLRIITPKFVGRMLFRNNVMASRENIRWLKTDLHTCGLDLQKLSELPANLEQLLDVKLEVTKRTKGENENVYLNRRIAVDSGAASRAPDGRARRTHDDDETPF